MLGENPLEAVELLIYGAFGYGEAIGYTLFYATNFIFTGLAVAMAFHAGLFNIGGEGQAYLGGLGAASVGIYLGLLPCTLSLPLAVRRRRCSAASGPYPGLAAGQARQPCRHHDDHAEFPRRLDDDLSAGQHPDQARPAIPGERGLPRVRLAAAACRHPRVPWASDLGAAPANLSFLIALVCCVLVWLFIWKTRFGYAAPGRGPERARRRLWRHLARLDRMLAMTVSGALAGLVASTGARRSSTACSSTSPAASASSASRWR